MNFDPKFLTNTPTRELIIFYRYSLSSLNSSDVTAFFHNDFSSFSLKKDSLKKNSTRADLDIKIDVWQEF